MILPNFVAINRTTAKVWQFDGSPNGSHPPSWIFKNSNVNGW